MSTAEVETKTRLQKILTRALDGKASDIHLVAGRPPMTRINTVLHAIEGEELLERAEAEAMVLEMLGEERYAEFQRKRDADFSTAVPGRGRFRVNAHYQQDLVGMAFRVIPNKVPVLEELNLPEAVQKFANLPRGLVLVTGDTGSGKTTTLAGLLDKINQSRRQHIITLEDPVEYVIPSKSCLVEQREIGGDCPSFASALRHVVRQDPDIILVGEMRDLETVGAAVTAAETGHFVLSTLHTIDAPSTIERIIDFFPPEQQTTIRGQLANTLRGVVSQTLLPRVDQPGMIPAVEVMVMTPAIRNCIREDRLFEIPNIISTNRGIGMQTLDGCIKDLYERGIISRESALSQASNPDRLAQVLN